jgi:glucokinase
VSYIIGVDIGGTQTRAALADHTGHIITELYTLTAADQGVDVVVEQVAHYINRLRELVPPNEHLLGVGVGCPGPLDTKAGIVFFAPNLPGWHNVPLRDMLEEQTGITVRLSNDANAAVLGEWYFGGGKGYSHIVYITISTGIGSGVIVDGRPLFGNLGAGGELGHMIIDSKEQKTWEQLASGTALKVAAAATMETHMHTMLHELGTPETITAADVALAASKGDAVAQRLMHREASLIGLGLVNVLHLFSPEIILIGGSVVTANPSLIERARSVVQEHVIADVYRSVPIEMSHLGNRVGMLGAVSLLLIDEYPGNDDNTHGFSCASSIPPT